MPEIVTLTINPAVDYSATVDHVTPGEKLRCHESRRDPGGGGINVARVVKRLGGEARAVFPVGGRTGELLLGLLEDEGVPVSPVRVAGVTREDFTAHELASGRNFRFVMPGFLVPEQDRQRLLDEALGSHPAYLVASGSLPPGAPVDFYAGVAARCREAGVRLVLDTSGEALRQAVEPGVFLLKPNLRELGHLAGREVTEDPEQERAARALMERDHAAVVVVSLGAAGVLLVTGEGSERIHAPTVPIRSGVGAGDSMVAAITLALSRGQDVSTAVRFGVAAGAAAVMTPGTELCRREDVERLSARITSDRV